MKSVLIAFLVVFVGVSGCVQTSAPEMAQFKGQSIQLNAKVTPGLLDGELELYVNNELVIKERSQAFGGSSQTFTGQWRGKDVRARATQVTNMLSSYVMIDVFIDGVLVDTLTI